MSENQLYSKVKKKYKATTNSKHHLPVAENLLNRNFEAEKPNQKLVSDITYVATEEGFLYVAAINDLCGGLNVGLSMSTRMTKELVLNALDDAYRRGANRTVPSCIRTEDRNTARMPIKISLKSTAISAACLGKGTVGTMLLWSHFGGK